MDQVTVEGRGPLLAWLGWSVAGVGVPAEGPADQVVDRVHIGLYAGTDVVHAAQTGVERREVGANDVGHVDVVARLEAITVDDRHPALDHRLAEDGDHSRFAVRVLPGPV